MIKKLKKFPFLQMAGVLAIFLFIGSVLFLERMGITVSDLNRAAPYLPADQVVTAQLAMAEASKNCLLITDLGREDCVNAYAHMERVLLDMKVGYDLIDIGDMEVPDDLSAYETMVILTPDMDALGDRLLTVYDWIRSGGRAMFAMTLEINTGGDFILRRSGVLNRVDYVQVDRIWLDDNFVVGGGNTFDITDGFDSAIAVQLRDGVSVYAAADHEGGNPLIWSYECGEGRMVMDNFGFYDYPARGFMAASYSLLEDVSAYPVLNGASIFLDDMPSPVPEGNSEYITRDYHVSVAEFYMNIWFPDIQQLSEKYQLPLIGLVIENYEDDTTGATKPQTDTSRFSYFGNCILRQGGELSYHGYNHQPLRLDDVDYGDEFSYNTWPGLDAMDASFQELLRFCRQLYPTAAMSLYVPPSNIMSQDGREYLASLYPTVRTISGTYLPDQTDFPYVQEFGVGEDGIVNFPRITSGSILDPYMRLVALSELNFHFVLSHFIHPDDAMDVDRGAKLGWEYLENNMDGFFDWVFAEAPAIRRLDSAHMSGTIQRWSGLTVSKQWTGDHSLNLHLGNYIDEAYLFVRFNSGTPDRVTGGTLTALTETLYLLDADQADITIEWNR